jgi:chromosome segregation ATPase
LEVLAGMVFPLVVVGSTLYLIIRIVRIVRYYAWALVSWLSNTINRELASRLDKKLKRRYDELSVKLEFYQEQLDKKVTTPEASVRSLTKQGIVRDDRCENASTKYLERLKTLELQVDKHQSYVNEERSRTDNLVSKTQEIRDQIEGLEPKWIAIVEAAKSTSNTAEPSTQPTKVEPADGQLEKRVSDLKQSQLVAAKRLDALELRSRLNASIVDQLKENLAWLQNHGGELDGVSEQDDECTSPAARETAGCNLRTEVVHQCRNFRIAETDRRCPR